jgi:hypothetical protein
MWAKRFSGAAPLACCTMPSKIREAKAKRLPNWLLPEVPVRL